MCGAGDVEGDRRARRAWCNLGLETGGGDSVLEGMSEGGARGGSLRPGLAGAVVVDGGGRNGRDGPGGAKARERGGSRAGEEESEAGAGWYEARAKGRGGVRME